MVFSIPLEQQAPFIHDSEPPVCPCGHPNVSAAAPAEGLDPDRLTAIIESRMSLQLAFLQDDGKTVQMLGPEQTAWALVHLYKTGDVLTGLPPLARHESGSRVMLPEDHTDIEIVPDEQREAWLTPEQKAQPGIPHGIMEAYDAKKRERLTCRCGHPHASGTDGEDAGCPCGDAHEWEPRP